MGGAGDSSPQSGRGESRGPHTTQSSSRKRRRSQSRRRDSCPTVPFPLQDHEGRLQAIWTLYEEAGENRLASEMAALRGLWEGHPELGAEELQRLNNQVLLMIAEYHLMSASQGTHHVLPVLPEGATRLMPPLEDYLPGSFDGCCDVSHGSGPDLACRHLVAPPGSPRHVWRRDRRLTPGGGLRYRAPLGIFFDAQAFRHHYRGGRL